MRTRQREVHIGPRTGYTAWPGAPRQVGKTVRLMVSSGQEDPQDDMAMLAVGRGEEPHHVYMIIPSEFLVEVGAMLLEEGRLWEEQIERAAIRKDGRPDEEEARRQDSVAAAEDEIRQEGNLG